MKKCKLTIATVVLNDAEGLRNTIESVISQDWNNVEYLVIDGGSEESTLSVIRKYENSIDQWISEPDRGTYDAMNKAIKLATGDFILFLNAGDQFASDSSVSTLLKKAPDAADLIYGDHEVVYPTFVKYKRALPLDYLFRNMIFSHQSLATRLELLRNTPFDLSFRIAADFNFIINAYLKGYQFYHVPSIMVRYEAGGLSEVQVIKAYRENRKIIRQAKPGWSTEWYFFKLLSWQKLLGILRSILPKKSFEALMRFKNRNQAK